MRDIKFRGKRINNREWVYGFLNGWKFDNQQVYAIITPEEVHTVDAKSVGQFTGLHDKNGKEIYEQDILRIKGVMGDDKEYKFDALYRVNSLRYEGLSLSFVKLFNLNPDSAENSYPINQSPSFKYGSLNTDYRNNNDDRLVIPDTTGRNDLHRHSWKEHHYTNDIEIIDNAELLNA